MKKPVQILLYSALLLLVIMCNRKDSAANQADTILEGKTSIVVDESLYPIIEDQLAVFESSYKAKITLIPKSETEAMQTFLRDSVKIIILTRELTPEENKFFASKNRFPKVTNFAKDAIALIANKQRSDTLVALRDVVDFMQGKTVGSVKGLVFDNPNSGTVHYMNRLAGLTAIPAKGVYSFKTTAEVIKFVSQNPGMIGIVGINWIAQPTPEIESYLKNINVLNVQGLDKQGYYAPTQNNLAEGTYPLARDLFLANSQGYDGLGMGFASFIAGDRGQRIILQSGLLPARIPSRKIHIVK
jgi:phosphate transport system substrate-binding protein